MSSPYPFVLNTVSHQQRYSSPGALHLHLGAVPGTVPNFATSVAIFSVLSEVLCCVTLAAVPVASYTDNGDIPGRDYGITAR